MNIAVIGAGVVGVATAYALVKAGFKVSLFEKNNDVGLEASFANGAQLSYSYVAPLAEPSALKDLPKYLIYKKSPLKFNLKFNLKQWLWGLQFIKACSAAKSAQTTSELLSLSYFSRAQMHDFIEQKLSSAETDFQFRKNGKLVIYRCDTALLKAAQQVKLQQSMGSTQSVLDKAQCLAIEPSLSTISEKIVGGVYTPSEELGDCYEFSKCLLKELQSHASFSLYLNSKIVNINQENNEFKLKYQTDTANILKPQQLSFAQVVLSAGIESIEIAKQMNVSLPLYALKGYSLTVALKDNDIVPEISITDSAKKIVYARLGDTFRIAAMVDMGDATKIINPQRIAQLIEEAQEMFPTLDYANAIQWTGLRPATAQGKPIIDESPIPGLWLNVGHGALGFTLALGSGELLAELIRKKLDLSAQVSLDPEPFSYANVR
ncbi:D-amino acid dehydrogenase [Gammaproteobacteria bacterium]|nr:D-amino acid dehydrogenase [Gammaproteobacteria bacterium]